MPIAGVLLLGWSVFPLVLLYWLENVIVGGCNVAKMLLAQPREAAYWAGKLFIVPFFIAHFGLFTFVHGVLLVALLGPKGTQPFDILGTVPPAIRANHLGWAVVSLAQPCGRVVVLHLTVLFGGWIVMTLGSPLLALLLLVVLKTAADLRAHQAERRKFAALPTR